MNGTALSQRDQGWLERPRERREGGALGERATCVWGQKVLPYTQLKLASLFGFSCVLALSASLSRTSSPSEHWFPHTCLPLCRSSESQAASRSFSEGGFWGSQLPAYSVPFECAVPWAWSALSHSSSRPPGQMLPLLGSLPVPPHSLPCAAQALGSGHGIRLGNLVPKSTSLTRRSANGALPVPLS